MSVTVDREQELMQCYITFSAMQHIFWQHLPRHVISFSCQTWSKRGGMFKVKMWQLCLLWKYGILLKTRGPRSFIISSEVQDSRDFFSRWCNVGAAYTERWRTQGSIPRLPCSNITWLHHITRSELHDRQRNLNLNQYVSAAEARNITSQSLYI